MNCIMQGRPRASRAKKEPWAKAITQRRLNLGLTQEELAEKTGFVLSQGNVSDIERGKTHPTSTSFERFAALLSALEWSIEDFSIGTGIAVSSLPHTRQQENQMHHLPDVKSSSSANLGKLDGLTSTRLRKSRGWTVIELSNVEMAGIKKPVALQVENDTYGDETTRQELSTADIVIAEEGEVEQDAAVWYLDNEGYSYLIFYTGQQQEQVRAFDGAAFKTVNISDLEPVGIYVRHTTTSKRLRQT